MVSLISTTVYQQSGDGEVEGSTMLSFANTTLATSGWHHNGSTNSVSRRDQATVKDGVSDELTVPGEKVPLAVLFGAIIIVAIFGNVLVCIAISSDRHLRKLNNFFLVSLAVADLFVAATIMPPAAVQDVTGYWPLGFHACNVWLAADITFSTGSILNLCVISMDRFVHIRNPYRYKSFMNKRVFAACIIIIWGSSVVLSTLPISLSWHLPADHPNEYDLWQNTTHPMCALVINPYYAIISSSISFFLPCLVMMIIYAKLYSLARSHVKTLSKDQKMMAAVRLRSTPAVAQQESSTENGANTKLTHSSTVIPRSNSNPGPTQYKSSDYKALITLGVIMGTFMLCWLPFFICNVIAPFCSEPDCIPAPVFVTFIWFGYVNSMLNPLIYSIFNLQFRRAFKKIIFHAMFCLSRGDDFDYYDRRTEVFSATYHVATPITTAKGPQVEELKALLPLHKNRDEPLIVSEETPLAPREKERNLAETRQITVHLKESSLPVVGASKTLRFRTHDEQINGE